jgi:histidine ammonia-lyase
MQQNRPTHSINAESFTTATIGTILSQNYTLQLSDDARTRIQACRDYLDRKITGNDDLFYGINTGFGSLCNIRISDEDIEQLQYNLVT